MAPHATHPPRFSPPGGNHHAQFLLSLYSPTSRLAETTIYYTTDGSTPSADHGLVFDPTNPIIVSSTQTVSAIAVAEGYAPSQAVSATYNFEAASPAKVMRESAGASASKGRAAAFSYGGASACSAMSVGSYGNLNGFIPFPASNLWNTNIAAAPLDPNSAAITAAAGFAGLHLHPDFGAEQYYGIPYAIVDSTTTPSVPIHVIDYAAESDILVAPFPTNAPIESALPDCTGWPSTYQSDAHVLVLDRSKCVLYETFNTNRCNGSWNASNETLWDMKTTETRPYGWTSADAAGLPIFPGLVRYDEIEAGAINHALRFTMQQTKNNKNNGYFVLPANHAAGTVWGVSNVEGMRIRLKASFDISHFSAVNQIILTAMKQYGMILADNGGYFYFQGAADPRWDDDDLSQLSSVQSSNFEIVQMTPAFPGADSETALGLLSPGLTPPVISHFAASPTSVTSGSAVTFNYTVTGDSYDYIDMIGPVTAGTGSVTIYPTATQTYTLYSRNGAGSTSSTAITVTVPGSVVTAPVFTPPAGLYGSAPSVTIATPTSPSATIHYTTNGTTPTANSAVFSIGSPITVSSGQTLKAIAVAPGYSAASAVASATYTIGTAAATPTFSVGAGTYASAQTVAITTATPSARIYYTTDSTTPTTGSTLYVSPISIPATVWINAIATATGLAPSAVAQAQYIITPTAPTPAFTPAAGSYSSTQTVTITSAAPGAKIYYTTNGTTPTTSSTQYSGPITVSTSETVNAIATATGYLNSAVGSATYSINSSPPAAATPTFNPAGGTYTAAQSVTISTTTPSATIYYTTNGSTPTTSSAVFSASSPIPVTASQTLRAIATAAGYSTSAVGSATYTISTPGAPVLSIGSSTRVQINYLTALCTLKTQA